MDGKTEQTLMYTPLNENIKNNDEKLSINSLHFSFIAQLMPQ